VGGTGQVLTVTTQRETDTSNNATIQNGRMSIYVEKIEETSNVFFSRGSQVTVNSGNWNPGGAGQLVEWENDVVIDTNIYIHSTVTAPQEITVNEDGDYLLVYNDALNISGTGRQNPLISVEVNGIPVSGAQTKTHYMRNSNQHLESSGSLVYLLNGLTAGSVVRVRVTRDVSNGGVGALDDALLVLWKKEGPPGLPDALANPGFTNVAETTAGVSVDVSTTGAVYEVSLYWGTTDGGTNAGAWANSMTFGSFTNGSVTHLLQSLSGLTPGATYTFAWQASNCADQVWAGGSFVTLIAPAVSFTSRQLLNLGTIALGGRLDLGQPADARIYWGESDGGTDPAQWDHQIDIGSVNNGNFSGVASNLLYGLTYYYRIFAT
ncbi:MAG: hypothetical protein AAF492_29950, partial [Verrucomicrobiota bacterium]